MSRPFCLGCSAEDEPLNEERYCLECVTYFTIYNALGVNLCVWLERWRKRHNLDRQETLQVVRELLDINDDLLLAAMAGEDKLTR